MEECLCFPLLFSFPACQTLGQRPFLFPFVAVVVVAAPSVVHFFVASLFSVSFSSPRPAGARRGICRLINHLPGIPPSYLAGRRVPTTKGESPGT